MAGQLVLPSESPAAATERLSCKMPGSAVLAESIVREWTGDVK